MRSPICLNRHRRPTAERRLLCFPYGGGGAHVFARWQQWLPETIEVWTVELPGHGRRLYEDPYTSMAEVVDESCRDLPRDVPWIAFGHSLGALLAFEVARRLEREGQHLVRHLFVSACRAPHVSSQGDTNQRTDEEFQAYLERTRNPIIGVDDRELRDRLARTLRADMAMCDDYHSLDRQALRCDVTAFAGLSDDSVAVAAVREWCACTLGQFRMETIPGDHLFLDSAGPILCERMTDHLGYATPRR